jgi:hypothetical protein
MRRLSPPQSKHTCKRGFTTSKEVLKHLGRRGFAVALVTSSAHKKDFDQLHQSIQCAEGR